MWQRFQPVSDNEPIGSPVQRGTAGEASLISPTQIFESSPAVESPGRILRAIERLQRVDGGIATEPKGYIVIFILPLPWSGGDARDCKM